jgi:hypothetical protein
MPSGFPEPGEYRITLSRGSAMKRFAYLLFLVAGCSQSTAKPSVVENLPGGEEECYKVTFR